MQKNSELIVISSPIQSLGNRSYSGWRNQVNCAAVGNRRNESLVPQTPEEKKKRAASQEEQRMRDEECYSDVEEEAKEGGGEEKARG